jgi:iron complex outermembrane receptor protein
MKRMVLTLLTTLAGIYPAPAQQPQPDTIPLSVNMQEIVVTAKTGFDRDRQAKPGASVEEYLQTSEKVGMIKRGAYAWEPSINSMTAERISVTIDGMKIFHACTDRMDPVTSYVETVNLSKVSLGSGFDANPNATNSIGGSLDLKLNKSGFCQDGFSANASSGYESNGNLRLGGADIAYATPRFYLNSGYFRRGSDNYSAGGGETVRFSQFTKNNVFANIGYSPKQGHDLEASIICDRASDVGYPALTMDVARAEGLITSLAYTAANPHRHFYKWETKVYYNNIVHIMDDTKRPPEEIAMHMDMPGKSRTGGFYSTLSGRSEKHRYSLNWDAYYNRSYAEMTMYPNNPDEMPMFMLAWGDVRTANTGLFGVDEWRVGDSHSVRLSGKLSFQRAGVASDFGYESLLGYYPEAKRFTNRAVGNIAARYLVRAGDWDGSLSVGYGSRAPSVSEAYGFFLFNTFDAYDYLGNPHLKNESSLETSASLRWRNHAFEAKAEVSHFYFNNYIIGRPSVDLHRMTVGATGVKAYQNLPHASLLNAGLLLKYRFSDFFTFNGRATYARGRDGDGGNLPLIAPFGYDVSLKFGKNRFVVESNIAGAARQTAFSPGYGEDETERYAVAGFSAGYSFKVRQLVFNLKAGVENLFDTYYSTYADWKNIPRKGRNIFVNLGIELF